MENKIESEVQDMILKQKTHFEARRNQIKYPKTTDGRKRYIRDSLAEPKKVLGKCIYLLLVAIGIIGLVFVLAAACIKSYISQGDWFMLILAAAVSMMLVAIGVHGFDAKVWEDRR